MIRALHQSPQWQSGHCSPCCFAPTGRLVSLSTPQYTFCQVSRQKTKAISTLRASTRASCVTGSQDWLTRGCTSCSDCPVSHCRSGIMRLRSLATDLPSPDGIVAATKMYCRVQVLLQVQTCCHYLAYSIKAALQPSHLPSAENFL